MRNSKLVAALLVLSGAGTTVVSASDTNGDNLALNGSDTLFQVTNDVMNTCASQLSGHGLTYVGGGTGTAVAAMGQLSVWQKLAPMSRPFKKEEYCALSANGSSNQRTEALLLGLDGISIVAGTEEACSPGLATSGRSFKYPDPVAGPNTYSIQSSIDVLRLIYGGLDHDGNFDCNGSIRRALVLQWSKLFSIDCGGGKCDGSMNANGSVQPIGLSHAWRHADLAGTTDAFVSLVGFGSRRVGGSPLLPSQFDENTYAFAQNPFCNTLDANDNTGNTMSAGGAGDYIDKDPIRIRCDDNDVVCELDGTLGLVLPIQLPDVSGVEIGNVYPPFFGHECPSCVLSKIGDPARPCPKGGPKKLGRCYQPGAANGDIRCNANLAKKCFGDQPGDGRVYNLPVKVPVGSEPAEYLMDANGNLITGAFYRIHQVAPSSYSTGVQVCQEQDSHRQIGCLIGSDPCSVGFAGREADVQPSNQILSVDGQLPTDPNLLSLLDGGVYCDSLRPCPSGQMCNTILRQCFPNGEVVYPFARKLWLGTIFGFETLQGGEAILSGCFGDNNNVGVAIQNANFVKLPSPGIRCVDYPENSASALVPLQGVPGCDLGGSNVDACVNNTGLIRNAY